MALRYCFEQSYVPRTLNTKRTGERIKELQAESGLSCVQMQDYFGFNTPQAIYKWRNGKSMPTIDNLVILAHIFGVKIDDIIVTEGEA